MVRAIDELIPQCLRKIAGLVEAIESTVKKPLHEARALGADFGRASGPFSRTTRKQKNAPRGQVVKLDQRRRLAFLCGSHGLLINWWNKLTDSQIALKKIPKLANSKHYLRTITFLI
jgi:hypothetical protein